MEGSAGWIGRAEEPVGRIGRAEEPVGGIGRTDGPVGRIGRTNGSSGPALAWGKQTVLARAYGPLRASTFSGSRQLDPRGGQFLRSHPPRPPGAAPLLQPPGSTAQLDPPVHDWPASPAHDRLATRLHDRPAGPVQRAAPAEPSVPDFSSRRVFLWVIRDALEDTLAFAALADTAVAIGCTDLLVQVRGRGEAYYMSATEPAPRFLETPCPDGVRRGERPSEESLPFDPLAAAGRVCRSRGLRLHAWINVFLAGNWDRNGRRNAVIQHPEWTTRLKDGRPLAGMRASEGRRLGVEGIYLSPGNPEVLPYIRRVVRELVMRYPLDGLHLDYIRYPHADAGYDEASREAFLIADLEESIPPSDNQTDDLWDRWRMEQVSRAVEEIARVARSTARGIEITAAVIPDPGVARRSCKQDWPRWIREGWVDAVLPMAYTASTEKLNAWLGACAAEITEPGRIVPGMGLHKIDGRSMGRHLEALDRPGFRSYALFSSKEIMASRPMREAIRKFGGDR